MFLHLLGISDRQTFELESNKVTEEDVIGEGAFGKVYHYRDKGTGIEMAVKVVRYAVSRDAMSKNELCSAGEVRKEIEILRRLDHKGIVKYYGMTESDGSVSIFMEYIKGGSIYDLIKKQGALPEDIISKYCRQILEALTYLHKDGDGETVAHRDLKCRNILLDNHGHCKLADFGLSKSAESIFSTSGLSSMCGTFGHMSPEILDGENYGWKTDIWSFGCTVLEMLAVKPAGLIRRTDMDSLFPSHISAECRQFVKQCLQKNPKDRPSAKELLSSKFISMFE